MKYYNSDNYECIEVIEDWGLDFCLGNCLKYLCRIGTKPGSSVDSDARKALWYARRALTQPTYPRAPTLQPSPEVVATAWGAVGYRREVILAVGYLNNTVPGRARIVEAVLDYCRYLGVPDVG